VTQETTTHKRASADGQTGQPGLKRVLSTPLLTLYGLGVTIGAGIYVLVGETAAVAGVYAPISFLVAAAVVVFVALSYAELAVRMPVSAGEATYVRRGYNSRTMSILVGLLVTATGVVSAAAVAIGAAEYVKVLLPVPTNLIIFVIVAVLGLAAAKGILESVSVAALFTLIEIGGLAFAIYSGVSINPQFVASLPTLLPPLEFGAWTGIFAAGLLAFFAFIGFEDMVNVAEEVKRPAKTIPRAIILTLIITTLIYVAVVSVVVLTVPMDTLAGSDAALSLLFGQQSEASSVVFTCIAILATMNGVLIQMIMSSRVLYGLAAQGALPGWLAKLGASTRTPLNATGLVVVIILLLALAFPINILAELTSQIVLATFILVSSALVAIKIRDRRLGSEVLRPEFSVPIWVPLIGATASALLLFTGFL
jgi:amino acid transporter